MPKAQVNTHEDIGIVLRRFMPQKQTFSLFLFRQGKEQVLIDPQALALRLWPGSIISCVLERENTRMLRAMQVEILAVPLHHDASGILWLHRLLAFCYYFLPLSHQEPAVFEHVYSSMRFFAKQQHEVLQELALAKVLVHFDYYPETWLKEGLEIFDRALEESIDFHTERTVEWQQHVKHWSLVWRLRLEAWIADCITHHPQGTRLRAVAFADKASRLGARNELRSS